MTEVNMLQMQTIADAVFTAGFPLLIRGRHGIGKSAFIYQWAKNHAVATLGLDNLDELEVIEMRASLMTEGDLTGLPYRGPVIAGQESTKFNPPEWYLRACAGPVVLFFDEVDRGPNEVRQGIFQINDSRMLNGHRLHPKTRVVACINGGAYGGNYQVGDFDPAELDRYSVYDLEPTIAEWLAFARKEKFLPEIISFIVEFEKFLEIKSNDAVDPNRITPSRRSWHRLSDTLKSMSAFDEGFSAESKELLFLVAGGFVGEEAASTFANFAIEFRRNVSPEDVIFNNQTDLLDKMSLPEFVEFAEAVAASNIMKRTDMTEKNISNIRQIVFKMPTEALIVFFQSLCAQTSFEPETILKLGWDYDNEETEEEQIEFTRVIATKLIDPEDPAFEEMLKKAQERAEEKKKEAEAAKDADESQEEE